MDEQKFRKAMAAAVQSSNDARGDDWADAESAKLDSVAIGLAIVIEPVATAITDPAGRGKLGYIVARAGRGGAPVSIKPSNITRDVSRTVQVAALFGLADAMVATGSDALRVLNALVGLGFAAYAATRANIGYSDASVLHKAWKISVGRAPPAVTSTELVAARHEIARDYTAPKCVSETEIYDAIENLCGLKAIKRVGDQLLLQEHIVFFEDGGIKN